MTTWPRKLFSPLRAIVAPVHEIHIVEQTEDRLVLTSGEGELAVSRKDGTMARSGRVLATFDEVRSIDIVRRADEDGPVTWRVSLHLSALSRIRVGASTDDVEASEAAAHLSTITGKKVLAWK